MTSNILRGNSPRALHRSTWKANVSRRGSASTTHLQGRVGHKAAVPVMLAFDLDGRQAGRQRAAGHDVFGSDRIGISIEINEIARPDVHSASAEARSTRVETIEIYQTLEGMLESADVVEAGGLDRPGGLQPRGQRPRSEESFCSACERNCGTDLVEKIAPGGTPRSRRARIANARPKPVRSYLGPKVMKPVDTGMRRIACDNSPVDSSNRYTGDPGWMNARFRQGPRRLP